ncbi:MAG: hypothetical protein GF347_00160 [Candidatus Moranbacteria bacterium]|nr:hypothetical protein [Candidatus Moranbacteria bacterium]
MKNLIIYRSVYGSTKEYAQWIADAIGADIFSLEEAENVDLNNYENIVLGCGVYAGKIKIKKWIVSNWDKLKSKNKVVLFTTSGSPAEEIKKEKMIERNLPKEILAKIRYFPLGGRMVIEDLNFFHKLIIKLLAKMTKDPGLKKRSVKGFNFMDKKNIDPILDYLKA